MCQNDVGGLRIGGQRWSIQVFNNGRNRGSERDDFQIRMCRRGGYYGEREPGLNKIV